MHHHAVCDIMMDEFSFSVVHIWYVPCMCVRVSWLRAWVSLASSGVYNGKLYYMYASKNELK